MVIIQETILSVPDVSCQHCVKAINEALSKLSGVEKVVTDIPSKTIHLRYDSNQLSMQQVEAALDDAGYAVAK